MPAIIASAPGKIILFGEHAVVYGRPAIAVPVVQVKAKAIVTAQPKAAAGSVRIQAPNVGLDASLDELSNEHPLAAVILGVARSLNLSHLPACTVRISSTIPVAAGMGSGAAVSVAVIRALSAFLGHPLPDEQVSELAYQIEKIYHGTPSGIDNTVITYAKPVYFVRGKPVATFKVGKPFSIVIGDTGINSPTAVAVGEVRRAWEAEPAHYEEIFDRIGSTAHSARQAIETGSLGDLGALMRVNQQLLQEINVSSPELDRLVKAAEGAGALGAKLSGAGGGGNMIALVDKDQAQVVAKAMVASGATRIILTEIGNPL